MPVIQQPDWPGFGIQGEPIKVNYSEVAKAADTNEAVVVYVLKQLIAAIQNTVSKDYHVKINLRIGWLKVINQRLFFDQLGKADRHDHASTTSCGTEFKFNKRFMTNIRTRKEAALEERESITYRSSVRDIISNATAKTPRSSTTSHFKTGGTAKSLTEASAYHAANPNP